MKNVKSVVFLSLAIEFCMWCVNFKYTLVCANLPRLQGKLDYFTSYAKLANL